ncbi:MAG: DUF1292 domain-containing protein [Lachnospiraceae bacterium]|nr:DUF1292 domain-containing protein [Lachnospiraceae bacterium]MCR5748164.1 DUF1292 domain-containing protein [Lachnospiraceae bacterium]
MGIKFTDENNEETEYEVIETTTLGGNTYLLVADEDDNACILKEVLSESDEDTAAYTEEMTDSEYDAVAAVFGEMLQEYDISLQ